MADILSQKEIDDLLSVAEDGSDVERRKRHYKKVVDVYSVFKSDIALINSMTQNDVKLAIAVLWNTLGILKSETPKELLKYCGEWMGTEHEVECCPKCESTDIELRTSEAMYCNSCGKNF